MVESVSVELTRSDEGGAVVIAVAGDLDIATADQLFRESQDALRTGAGARLVLDLSGVAFLDSSGIGTLVELRNVANDSGGSLVLRRPSERTRRLLEITALDTVFTIDA
jgi:anti-sigma B factor antagonist